MSTSLFMPEPVLAVIDEGRSSKCVRQAQPTSSRLRLPDTLMSAFTTDARAVGSGEYQAQANKEKSLTKTSGSYIAAILAAPLILSLSLPAPVLAATDLTTQGSAIGSGVYGIAVLGVIVVGIIATGVILISTQGKFLKGIELFLTVVLGVVIVGQLNSWGTAQAAQRTTLVAALFNGGQGGGTTAAMTEDTLNQLMK